jgi:aminoglycoside phosphotransferase (APT) family kinase protein
VDGPALAACLADWWAAREGVGAVEVTAAGRPAVGASNETWLLDAAWSRSAGERITESWVLRLAPAEVSLFPRYDLEREYRTLVALQGASLRVPLPRRFEADGAVLGRPFFVMARLPGRVVQENPLYHLEGWFHGLPAAAQAAHWNALVDGIGRLHRVDWQARGLGFLDAPPGTSRTAHQLSVCRQHLHWAESLARPYPALHRALDWLEAHCPAEGPVALCWGDAKLGNALFDADTGALVAALDWEMPWIGEPVSDLAWLLVLDRALSSGYGVPRLPGLPSREQSVARWQAASGHSAAHLDFHERMAATRFAIIMARVGQIYMAKGWLPRESELDLRNGGMAVLRELFGGEP